MCPHMCSDSQQTTHRKTVSVRGYANKPWLHQRKNSFTLHLKWFYVWEYANLIFYFLWIGENRGNRVGSKWPNATIECIIFLWLVIIVGSHIYECSRGKNYIETRDPLIITMMLLSTEPLVIITYRAEKMFLFLPNALFIEVKPKFTTEHSILGKVKGNRINLVPINKFLEDIWFVIWTLDVLSKTMCLGILFLSKW